MDLKELQTLYGEEKLVLLAHDVTSIDSHRLVKETLLNRNIKRIDVLVANAGISSKNHPVDPVLSCPIDDMSKLFETNVIGSMLTFQTFADMVTTSHSRIFMATSSRLASIDNALGMGGYTSYRASKAALNMFAATFSADTAIKSAGCKVILLHPGWVRADNHYLVLLYSAY